MVQTVIQTTPVQPGRLFSSNELARYLGINFRRFEPSTARERVEQPIPLHHREGWVTMWARHRNWRNTFSDAELKSEIAYRHYWKENDGEPRSCRETGISIACIQRRASWPGECIQSTTSTDALVAWNKQMKVHLHRAFGGTYITYDWFISDLNSNKSKQTLIRLSLTAKRISRTLPDDASVSVDHIVK